MHVCASVNLKNQLQRENAFSIATVFVATGWFHRQLRAILNSFPCFTEELCVAPRCVQTLSSSTAGAKSLTLTWLVLACCLPDTVSDVFIRKGVCGSNAPQLQLIV